MKYFQNTSWLFGEKILRMFVGIFVGIWVARYLGPQQFGLFNYAISFVGLFTAFATLGLDGIVIRGLVRDQIKKDVLLGTAFYLKLMGAFSILVFLAIAVSLTSNDTQTNMLIFIIASATIFQSFNVVDMYFQSKVMSKYIVYANILTLLITTLVKIILILNEAPLIAFALVMLLDSIILSMGFLYFFLKKTTFKISQLSFKREIAISLLKDSWPLILSGMIIAIYMQIDQVMLKEMLDAEAVGQYAAAVRLSTAWYFIPMVIASSLFPAILNAKKTSKSLYYKRLQKLYDMMIWMAIAIALPMTFLSDWIINILYGPQYNQAGSVLMIHIWGGIFVFFGSAWSKWIISENYQSISLKMNIMSMFSNVILNFILIPLYGITGAAIATTISYALGHTVFALFFSSQRIAVKMFWETLNIKRIYIGK